MGAFGSTAFPVVFTGNPATVLDTNPQFPVGSRFYQPLNPALAVGTQPYKGLGLSPVYAYVLYGSLTNPNFLAQPGVVYWVDESYTTVSGHYNDSYLGINGVAGYALINTTSYPGSYTGATLATLVNNGYSQSTTPYSGGSYIMVQIGGFLAGATSVTAEAAGDWLIGSTTDFTPARAQAGTAPANVPLGQALTAVSSSKSDVWLRTYGIA